MLEPCDFRLATHVRPLWSTAGPVLKIVGKWGIGEGGQLAKPSEGGFGCETEDGRLIDMWNALAYYQDVTTV